MNESTIQIPIVEGKIASIAFDIYQQMLPNIRLSSKEICSKCESYKKGMNSVSTRSHFHGSEFGQCFRKTQLDMNLPKEEYSNQKLIEFQDGHLHEDTIINLLEQSFRITEKNTEKILERVVKLETGDVNLKIVLHTDALLELTSLNTRLVIECKAVKNWFWKNRLLKNELPLTYFGQVQCYMEAYNANHSLIFFKNRESSEIAHPVIVKRDQTYINRRLNYLAAIKQSNSIPKLVPKEYQYKTSDACKFCRHFKLCWGDK